MDNKLQDIEYRVEELEKSSNKLMEVSNKLSFAYENLKDQPLTEPLHINSKKVIKNVFSPLVYTSLQGSSAATSGNYNAFWVADASYVVKSIKAFYSTASSSGTVNIYKTVSGTAIGSGIALLTTAISTAGTANTLLFGSLKTDGSITLKENDVLGLVSGGTLTSLANLSITINLQLL